jgi:hypothetical protein
VCVHRQRPEGLFIAQRFSGRDASRDVGLPFFVPIPGIQDFGSHQRSRNACDVADALLEGDDARIDSVALTVGRADVANDEVGPTRSADRSLERLEGRNAWQIVRLAIPFDDAERGERFVAMDAVRVLRFGLGARGLKRCDRRPRLR